MSTLSIIPPPPLPVPRVAPGPIIDAPASRRPNDVPRSGVVVEISEEVREGSATEKPDSDADRQRLRSNELTDAQQREIRELQKTDREVRSHEAAHKAAAGAYARGAAQFSTVTGPDGRRYATGGEVAIDTSPEDNPEATVRKMEQVTAAALAPADPSAQDRAVAAQAQQVAAEARREMLDESSETARAADAPAQSDGAPASKRLDAPERADVPPDARDIAKSPPGGTEAQHGHRPGDSCPICAAQGGPPAALGGSVDLSA